MKTPEELRAFRRETRSTFCANKSRGECDKVYRRIGALVKERDTQRDAQRDAASDRRARHTALRALDSCPSGEGRRARDCGEHVRRPEVPVVPRGYRTRFEQRPSAPVARNRRFDSPRGAELRSLEALRADHGRLDCLREEVARDERLLRRSKPSDGRGEALWVEEPLPRALERKEEATPSTPSASKERSNRPRRRSPTVKSKEPEPELEATPEATPRRRSPTVKSKEPLEPEPEPEPEATPRRRSPTVKSKEPLEPELEATPKATPEPTETTPAPETPARRTTRKPSPSASRPTRPRPSASIESTASGSALPTWTSESSVGAPAAPSAKEAQSYPSSNRPLPKREQSRPARTVRSGSPKASASSSSIAISESANSASAPERVIGSVPPVPKVPQVRFGLAPKPVPQAEAELSAEAEALLRQITRSAPSEPSASETSAAQIQEGWRALAKRSLDRLGKTASDEQIDALAHQLGPYYNLAPSAVPAAIASHPEAADQLSQARGEFGALDAASLAAHLLSIASELMEAL